MLDQLRDKDVVVVTQVDRLARSVLTAFGGIAEYERSL